MKKTSAVIRSIFACGAIAVFAGVIMTDAASANRDLKGKQNINKVRLMSQTLGKIDRIVVGCPKLMTNLEAIELVVKRYDVRRQTLIDDYRAAYDAGYAAMERVFRMQDEYIVCDAAVAVFGPDGSLYPGFLRVNARGAGSVVTTGGTSTLDTPGQ